MAASVYKAAESGDVGTRRKCLILSKVFSVEEWKIVISGNAIR